MTALAIMQRAAAPTPAPPPAFTGPHFSTRHSPLGRCAPGRTKATQSTPTPTHKKVGLKPMVKAFLKPSSVGEDWMFDRVEAALWRAFPEARSKKDLSEIAAPYFRNKRGEPVDPRTIRFWLERTSLPSCLHVMTLITMVGPGFFALSDPDRDGSA